MATCAGATRAELAAALAALGEHPAATDLRPMESGLVMLRGRMGGDGRPFNLGEASVTRAAIRLADGRRGFAYQLGRDREKARLAAILDALWQGAERARGRRARWHPVRARLAAEARLARATRCRHAGELLHHGAGGGLMTVHPPHPDSPSRCARRRPSSAR